MKWRKGGALERNGLKWLSGAGQGKNKVIKFPGQQEKVMSPGVPGGGIRAEQCDRLNTVMSSFKVSSMAVL